MATLAVGCSSERGERECSSLPPNAGAGVDRSLTEEEVTNGCRSFGPGGCESCCTPTRRLDGTEDCLILSERDGGLAESLTGAACAPDCEPCAQCSLDDEANFNAGEQGCDCSVGRDTLGFDPDVPCERTCYYLEVAARSCPHLCDG